MPGPVRNSGPLITPDEWLRAQLVRVRACNASSAIVDDEMLDTLPAYCARSRDEDLQEYILNILGDQGMATALVAEYLERKRQWAAMGTAGSTPNVWMAREQAQGRDSPHVDGSGTRPSGLRAYMKPRLEDVSGGSARRAEGNLPRFQRRGGGRERGSVTESPSVSATSGAPLPQPASAGRKRRNRAGPAVLGKEAGRRGVCDCQCTRHELVSNCLRCGKIVCEVEGEGPCSYCGALVVREGGEYESACGQEGELSAERIEAVRKATAFKDRLVEYDRTAAQRTEVIDDQADYFQVDGNAWLTDEEKKRLKKQMEERERAEEEKRRKVVVTFDLIGRKVVVASDGGQADSTSEISAVGMVAGEGRASGVRMKPNPTLLTPPPIFVDPRKFAPAGAGGARKRAVNVDTITDAMGQGSEERGEAPATLRLIVGTNRVLQGRKGGAVSLKAQARGNGLSRLQHDDPVVEAITLGIGGRGEWDEGESVAAFSWDDSEEDERRWSNEEGNGETSEEEEGGWQQPSVRVRGGDARDEGADGEECQLDPMARGGGTGGDRGREEEERPPVFDLCLPVKDMAAAIQLAPSLLEVKRQERRELNKKYPKEILREGMVLMKGWLDEDQQVEIVKECRRLGMGPGGFYQPRYGDGGRMHLQMMCLGQHWEPRSRAYKAKRTQYDGATPPPIPDMLKRLIVGALSDANDICMSFNATLGKKEKGVKLIPSMQADVCLVNFYDRNGSLGMHQDKDESEQSLADGAPVVSFSIGDSADFTFGVERDIEFASSVLLESGDVLIFGGVSRLIYHGVERIHPGTAPKGLIKQTSLRPGRLNLTFRQL